MEKDQEVKHICKFCYKSFPCGRALGGHMRSHLSNTAESAGKFSKKKLSTLMDTEDPGFKDDGTQIAYSSRENRKKTSKFAHSSEDSKFLFSHMKHHSDKSSNSIEDHSLNYCNEKEEMVLDSQSENDNEFSAPIRKQRSSRTFKRYRNSDTTTTTTTLSVTNALECASETEQEQEEVALSLILLSMDVYNRRVDLKSIDDSSDNNNSEFQEAMSVTRSDGKNFSSSENMLLNSKTLSSIDMEFERSSKLGDAFLKDSLITKNVSHDHELKKQKSRKRKVKALDQSQEISLDCSMKLDCDNVSDSQVIEFLGSEKKIKFECTSCNKTFHSYQALGGHRASHKKKASLGSKFDSTENSTDTDISTVTPQNFTSYNATGGSNLVSPSLVSCNVATKSAVMSQNLEPSIRPVKLAVMSQNLEPSNITDVLPITSQNMRSDIPRPRVFDPKFKSRKVIVSDTGYKKLTNSDHGLSKKHNKLHECPLCFKVFPSGQAFGGHKRYHLLAEAKNKQTENIVTEPSVVINQEQIPEKIRDFLDLNLPAPEQEEMVSGGASNPWWMASSNHKRQQPLHMGPLLTES